MEQSKFNKILANHRLWLDNNGGERANLRGVNLRETNLRGADLRGVDLTGAKLTWADLAKADLTGADLTRADLTRANLTGADLREADLTGAYLTRADLTRANLTGADLRGVDLDYSCLPLWCSSLSAHFDDRQLIQIAYHLVKAGLQSKNASEATKAELSKLIDFANKFHLVDECGKI